MVASLTHTVQITGLESSFEFGDLVELVAAGEGSGVPLNRRVRLQVTRGDQREPGSSTLTLSLAP